ncbi:MAG: rod shape-determining protein MreC [Rikenellaceae bacterium]
MNRFFLLFRRIHLFLLFVLIELGALFYYSNSSIYTNAKVINASNFIVRGVYAIQNSASEYLHLKADNEDLTRDITALQNQLEQQRQLNLALLDSLYGGEQERTIIDDTITTLYSYKPSRIVKNSVSHQRNFITIASGTAQGMSEDMAIISNGSVVGYILSCSENYSTGVSILSRDFKTSGKDINGNYFGSIRWDGKSYKEVILEEIPKYATVNVGDTIVTTQYSTRFPSGIKIGRITQVEQSSIINQKATIELFLDMTKLYNVVTIKNKTLEERQSLEEQTTQDNG